MLLRRVLAALSLIFVWAAGSGIHATELKQTIPYAGTVELDFLNFVKVRNLKVPIGPAILEIRSGILIPTVSDVGPSFQHIFIGESVVLLDPEDSVEQQQLELFTGSTKLEAEVTRAVIFTNSLGNLEDFELEPFSEEITNQYAIEAEHTWNAWLYSPERAVFNVDANLLDIALGDRIMSEYEAIWVMGNRNGNFLLQKNPIQREQIQLGRFSPLEIGDHDQHVAGNISAGLQKFGFFPGQELLLGAKDTWLTMPLKGEAGKPIPGGQGFAPEHVVLNGTISTDNLWYEGDATITVRAVSSGRATVRLILNPDFEVRSILDRDDSPLPWFHSRGSLQVLLPDISETDKTYEFRIEYAGILLREPERNSFALRSPSYWYPRFPDNIPVPSEMTLRWPAGLELVGSGRVLDSGLNNDLRWEHRSTDVPVQWITFELGKFKKLRKTVGDVEVEVAMASNNGSMVNLTQLLDLTSNAVSLFEKRFGDYPLDHMTLAVIPRSSSRGNFGFITMAEGVFQEHYRHAKDTYANEKRQVRYQRMVRTVGHEISHQWWGNKVLWDSYRDTWLSEALAEFSGNLFSQKELGTNYIPRSVNIRQRQQKQRVLSYGHIPLLQLGPVTTGYRLDSSLSRSAYEMVVYEKGALIFEMLATEIGTGRLIRLLREISQEHDTARLTTREFMGILQQKTSIDLRGFTKLFIRGIDMPELHYSWNKQESSDGSWRLYGTIDRFPSRSMLYRLNKIPAGWDVVSDARWHGDGAAGPFSIWSQIEFKPFSRSIGTGKAVLPAFAKLFKRGKIEDHRYGIPV